MASFTKQPIRQAWMRLHSKTVYINLNRYYILRVVLSLRALHKQGVDTIKCSDMYTFNPLLKHNETHA